MTWDVGGSSVATSAYHGHPLSTVNTNELDAHVLLIGVLLFHVHKTGLLIDPDPSSKFRG